MENTIVIILTFLLVTSCNNKDKMNNLEKRISNIESQNKILTDSLNSINLQFKKPFEIYEKIVLTELKNSPDKIISDYEILIKDYPNSYWKHEANKRIENIRTRKKYWSEKDGWKLPENQNEMVIPLVISCPGC